MEDTPPMSETDPPDGTVPGIVPGTVSGIVPGTVSGTADAGVPGGPIDVDAADPDPVALDQGRLLFARDCRFLLSVTTLVDLPATDLPEIAFAGRSNVGKSSLVNALTGRKTLARTSNTPGRTQALNFFDLDGRLTLVDLPGYGYAQAPKHLVQAWTRLVNRYLKGRPLLRRVFLLIDSRHGIKPVDREAMVMLDRAAVSYQVVLTKADKLKAPALAAVRGAVAATLKTHVAAHPVLLVTSAETGTGIAATRAAAAALAMPAAVPPVAAPDRPVD